MSRTKLVTPRQIDLAERWMIEQIAKGSVHYVFGVYNTANKTGSSKENKMLCIHTSALDDRSKTKDELNELAQALYAYFTDPGLNFKDTF